jgi:hypothetical protein
MPASVDRLGAAVELDACDRHAPHDASATAAARVELAVRENDGVSVTLVWAPTTNLLAVVVVDSRRGERFELVIEPDDRPLKVFYHPYAAAAERGVDLKEAA